MAEKDVKKVLLVVGSLRKGSFNRVLATYAAGRIAGRADAEILGYADVPLMNEDVEFPAPHAVERVREAVAAADGVWFFSPEYNGTVTGPLKNVVDWLSRPVVAGDYRTPRPLTEKPVAIAGAGGRAATAGSRQALRALLLSLDAKPVDGVGEGFVLPAAAWSTGTYDIPDEDRERIDAQAERLLSAL